MKSYNIRNYVIYKKQVQELIWSLPKFKDYKELTRDQLIICFLPLSENIARKFSTSQQASGVMTIMDLIQDGNAGLTKAVDRIDWELFDKSEPYNMDLLNAYLDGLLKKHLTEKEYNVLVLSYGLNCDKHSAKEIAAKLGIEGSSSYVRVSQLKKQAVDKLIENVDHSQVLDYL